MLKGLISVGLALTIIAGAGGAYVLSEKQAAQYDGMQDSVFEVVEDNVVAKTNNSATNTAVTQLFACNVEGCTQTGAHEHALCNVTGCANRALHNHDGILCYGHYSGDGHAYHDCGMVGCATPGAHTHAACGVTGCTYYGNHSHASGGGGAHHNAGGHGHHSGRHG